MSKTLQMFNGKNISTQLKTVIAFYVC